MFHPGHLHSLLAQTPSDSPDAMEVQEAEILGEAALGSATVGAASSYGFRINYKSVIITGIVFMLIVAWFDFIQTAFYYWYKPDISTTDIGPAGVFWFCILATILGGLIILGLIL